MLFIHISMIGFVISLVISNLYPSMAVFHSIVYISLLMVFTAAMTHLHRSKRIVQISRYSGLSLRNTVQYCVGRDGFASLLMTGLAIATLRSGNGDWLIIAGCYCFIFIMSAGILFVQYSMHSSGYEKMKLVVYLLIQMITKVVSIILIVGIAYATYQYVFSLFKMLPRADEWKIYQNEYGVVPSLCVGNDENIVFEQVNQNDIAMNGELYAWFNRHSAIYCRKGKC